MESYLLMGSFFFKLLFLKFLKFIYLLLLLLLLFLFKKKKKGMLHFQTKSYLIFIRPKITAQAVLVIINYDFFRVFFGKLEGQHYTLKQIGQMNIKSRF